jgi:hypothetical protein
MASKPTHSAIRERQKARNLRAFSLHIPFPLNAAKQHKKIETFIFYGLIKVNLTMQRKIKTNILT